jgi:anti-anti-sigma factor
MITLTQNDAEGVTVLRLVGELTLQGTEAVAPAFDHATPGAGRVVADLSAVTVMTTPGIALLLTATRRAQQAGGRFVVGLMTPLVAETLRRCRLDSILTIAPNLEDAVRKARE